MGLQRVRHAWVTFTHSLTLETGRPCGRNNGLPWSCRIERASQVALVVKNLPTNTGDIRDVDSVLGLGRSPGV